MSDQRFENLCYDVVVHDPNSNDYYLLLHGMSESKSSFRVGGENARANVIRLDRPGYGSSSYPERVDDYDYRAFSINVARLLRHLSSSSSSLLKIVGVVGFSSGGPYALHLCAHLGIPNCILLGSDVEYARLSQEERERHDPFHSESVFDEFVSALTAPGGIEAYSKQKDGTKLGLFTERELRLDSEGKFDDNLRLSIRRNLHTDVAAAVRVDHRLERHPWCLHTPLSSSSSLDAGEEERRPCALHVVVGECDPYFDANFTIDAFANRTMNEGCSTSAQLLLFWPITYEIAKGCGHFELLYDYQGWIDRYRSEYLRPRAARGAEVCVNKF